MFQWSVVLQWPWLSHIKRWPDWQEWRWRKLGVNWVLWELDGCGIGEPTSWMGKEYYIVWFGPGPFPVGNIITYLTVFALFSLHCSVVDFKLHVVQDCSELANYLSKINIVTLDISSPQSDLRYVRLLRNSDVHSFHCFTHDSWSDVQTRPHSSATRRELPARNAGSNNNSSSSNPTFSSPVFFEVFISLSKLRNLCKNLNLLSHLTSV
jgi:hypothetical protein